MGLRPTYCDENPPEVFDRGGGTVCAVFNESSRRVLMSMQPNSSLRGAAVLVTGATGFIGSHLVERLLSEGASVRCLVRPTSPRGGASRHLPAQGAKAVLGDLITGAGLAEALDGAGIVFHVA